jgi:prolyl 4-hydroxylase
MDILTINETPLVQVFKNFISKEDCDIILETMQNPDFNWEDAKKITPYGISTLDDTTPGHMASYSKIESEKYHQIISRIKQKIAIETGHPLENIGDPIPTYYTTSSKFDAHYDFFMSTSETQKEYDEIMRRGGNRVATAIINLNEDFSGGETYFDRLYKAAWPNKGQLIYFRYDYDDPTINIKTIHTGSVVEYGTKYILTFFIKELDYKKEPISYNKCTQENELINSAKDIEYELECGPDWDRRVFNINLPANNHPKNAIAIAVSGMDSVLVLYIIAMLNKLQTIPYRILPIASIPINKPMEQSGLDIIAIRFVTSEIKRLVDDDFITDLLEIKTPPGADLSRNPVATMVNAYKGIDPYWPAKHRNWKVECIYSGDLERPILDESWTQYASVVNKSPVDWWIQPLINLQKYHVIDCYYQLGIENLLKNTGTCHNNHSNPNELTCPAYACNERRWALMIMDKYDIIPYLLYDWRPKDEKPNY